MTSAGVSGIIPVCNGERFLAEAVDSMLGQTARMLEIIVVDDGSTDGTATVAASYGERVRYVRQPNRGPGAARNRGIDLARGELIAFLDADDLWHSEKVARQVERFVARPQLDYCVTAIENFWMTDVETEGKRLESHRRSRPMPGYVTVTLMARRALFDTVGRFAADLNFAGSAADWFRRARELGAVGELLPDVLTYRRMHSRNRSRQHAGESLDECLDLLLEAARKNRAADRSK